MPTDVSINTNFVLIDTNILVRSFDPDYPEHAEITAALSALAAAGDLLCFVPQVAYEIRHILTRKKEHNGFGLSAGEAAAWLDRLASLFALRFPDARHSPIADIERLGFQTGGRGRAH